MTTSEKKLMEEHLKRPFDIGWLNDQVRKKTNEKTCLLILSWIVNPCEVQLQLTIDRTRENNLTHLTYTFSACMIQLKTPFILLYTSTLFPLIIDASLNIIEEEGIRKVKAIEVKYSTF